MAQAVGQFLFSTCRAGNVRVRAYLRNTSRDPGRTCPAGSLELTVEVWHQQRRLDSLRREAVIPPDGFFLLDERDFGASLPATGECLFKVYCRRAAETPGYFAQEHQVVYEDVESGKHCSVLYDQLPILPPLAVPTPIVLLAPKAWVGRHMNSYVIFAGGSEARAGGSLSIHAFAEDGRRLATREAVLAANDAFVFDCRRELGIDDATPRFVNIFAHGGCSSYAISTLVKNELSHNVGIEHSLSPHYYISGNRARVRDDVVAFNWRDLCAP